MSGRIARFVDAGRRRLRPRPAILMYHRVASLPHDPWGLAVTPEAFDVQLRYLSQRRHPMKMDEFVAAARSGTLPSDAVAITFDDGYLDNLRNALPSLTAHRVAATLFVTTGHTGTTDPFWWDEVGRLILEHPGPSSAVIRVGGVDLALAWTDTPSRLGWRASDLPTDGRQAAFIAVWSALRMLPYGERRTCIAALRSLLGTGVESSARAMSRDELRELTATGTFELGAHTVTHPALSTLDREARMHEIARSRSDCEVVAGRPVAGFAYPYGDLNDAVRDDVVACGFTWACTTASRTIGRAPVDPYRLPRIAVGCWGANALARALRDA